MPHPQNEGFYDDGSTGDSMNVGQQYCWDANYNTWAFDHSPYAVAWLALSLISFIWVQAVLSGISQSPDIVLQEHKMRDLIAQGGSDNDEIAHGLSVAQVRLVAQVSVAQVSVGWAGVWLQWHAPIARSEASG